MNGIGVETPRLPHAQHDGIYKITKKKRMRILFL